MLLTRLRDHLSLVLSGHLDDEWHMNQLIVKCESMVKAAMLIKLGAMVRGDDKEGIVHQAQLVEFIEEVLELRIGTVDLLVVDGPPEANILLAHGQLTLFKPLFAKDLLLLL